MTLQEKQATFTENAAKLIAYVFASNHTCTFGDAYRTPEQAGHDADMGIGIRNSLHCKRLAVDLNLFNGKDYLTTTDAHKPFGEYWESLHVDNRWGGHFKKEDANHYEMRDI